MRSIYEINADIESCIRIDPETGDDIGTDFERLAELDMERMEKLENVAVFYKNVLAECNAVEEELKKLQARKKTLSSRLEGIKGYLFEQLNGEMITSGRVKTGYRTTSDVVDISDDAVIPEQYQRIKTEPDKTAIKAALKAGTVIDGVRLIDKVSITIK